LISLGQRSLQKLRGLFRESRGFLHLRSSLAGQFRRLL
jgi:hypothetical protein